MAKLFANSGDPDQTPHSVSSDVGLHCLPITLLWDYNGLLVMFSIAPEKRGYPDSIFLVLNKNVCCEYSLEVSLRWS